MLNRKILIFTIIVGALIGLWVGSDSLLAQYVTSTLPPPPPPPDTRPSAQQQQTPQLDLLFDVRPTTPRTYDDVQGLGEYAADLKDPSNITSVVEFDPETGCYVVHTKLGDNDIVTPYIMSPDEYSNADFRRSMMEYYRQKNAESAQDKEKDPFNFLDMQFGMGPLESVFGPGGLQLKTNGSVVINMGVKSNSTENPSLSVSQRRKTYFDFEQKIQANITATVGDKMRFKVFARGEGKFSILLLMMSGPGLSYTLRTIGGFPEKQVPDEDKWTEMVHETTMIPVKTRDNKQSFTKLWFIPMIHVKGEAEIYLDDLSIEIIPPEGK